MYLHMRTAHTRFGCTPPTGNRVMALFYFQIYKYTDKLSVWTHILVMDYQISLSPAEDFEGDIVLALSCCPSSFHPAGRLWTTESWPKAHCEVTCLPPLTKWESCQLLAKIWGKHWLWHPGRSIKEWLPLKWPKKCWVVISAGDMNFL